MILKDAQIGRTYTVETVHLPFQLERRLEALGMTRRTSISVLNRKGKGILIIKLRGTCFAQVEVPFTQTAGCGSKALTGAFSLHIMTIQLNDGLIIIFTKPIILERRFSK